MGNALEELSVSQTESGGGGPGGKPAGAEQRASPDELREELFTWQEECDWLWGQIRSIQEDVDKWQEESRYWKDRCIKQLPIAGRDATLRPRSDSAPSKRFV